MSERQGLDVMAVEQLVDGDEHLVTSPLIDLRSMHVLVDDDDPAQWPPETTAVWTATWARVQGLLPW